MADYMQYGCGFSAPPDWINFDASPTLRFERTPLLGRLYTRNAQRFPKNVRYGDITRGLPIAHGSCSGIYSSHVLEHLTRRVCEAALRNTFNYLAPGGIFRLVVPDLGQLARAYVEDGADDAGHRFMSQSGLGEEAREGGLAGWLSRALGNSRHLWLWDEKTLTRQLQECGFMRVRRCVIGDSEDPRFAEVEEASRFEGSLALEGLKPV